MTIPLSILDLVPIPEGSSTAQALQNTLTLARQAEAWGYQRYWLAEHHNMDGLACSATAVLIGQVAAATSRIRVGSGGVMLPNHAPLVVAEQFGTLATLFPDRIDLGLGRAPGTDGATARALRRQALAASEDAFPQDVQELLGYLGSEERPGQTVHAIPGQGTEVPVWLLGSSLFSAQLAAWLGLPFAFASHFAPDLLDDALDIYRRTYRPSARWPRPHTMVGVNVVLADTTAEAEHLFTSAQLRVLGMLRGQRGPLPRPIDPAELAGRWRPEEQAGVERMLAVRAVGDTARVTEQLGQLLARTRADELIVACAVHDPAARLASYQGLARVTHFS
ncbi:LLM class flavin-dependent oxidoreductase [Ideonella sp. B7]|uniref:LLM class flavin-dependent oxidoreductase n=1 Tax=Ideonella benzenivorans TaxID=2831643 RepID=UPI001CEC29FC|nr:LLM class flavin-dependent oxidoreductase [Ideonella benzenivorans]MCA6215652.1 LLM class flavin-dependent oxidoreductase [Ideonella benzenivorans]